MNADDALISVWRQVLVEGKNKIKLERDEYAVAFLRAKKLNVVVPLFARNVSRGKVKAGPLVRSHEGGPMPRLRTTTFLTSLLFLLLLPSARGQKPPLTLDELFDAVDIRSAQISPDGHDVAVETSRPDWAAQRFRNDLWLYRDDSGGSLVPVTQSGHDSSPQWSPDGRWIAFLSNREKNVAQVCVIFVSGGEAFPVTFGEEEVHAFAWSEDSRLLYFATRSPWTKAQKDAYTEEWKDVIRFREAERGDTLFSVDLAYLVAKERIHTGQVGRVPDPEKLTTLPYRVVQMTVSPDGRSLAIATDSATGRWDEPCSLFVEDLAAGTLHLALHAQVTLDEIHWAPDSRRILFAYSAGVPERPYQPAQTRLYSVDAAGGTAVRWASRFPGEVAPSAWTSTGGFGVAQDGSVFTAGRQGTETQPYTESSAEAEIVKQPAWAGTYETLSAARHSPRVAFVYSSLQRPREVYLAEGPERLEQAKPITGFNQLLAERELPQGKPYRWTADDGTPVEGMLIYPPGKFEAKHLPMLTLIHGGPEDANGNYFEADSSNWAALAATEGWLVFQPNYRGSMGYGDEFASGYVPHTLSLPGKDVLAGVDALVKDLIADPEQLAIGGYSYGAFLTTWLTTQTTRFKAAVSGAGLVDWAPGAGSVYISSVLRGEPWQSAANYNAEGAIWQLDKVSTPTHIVTGAEDRSHLFQDRILEGALRARGVPHSLLIFPGEGHGLDKNPWHGKIKVREELKWLEKYGRKK